MMKAGCPVGTIRDKNTNICVVKKEHLKPMVCWPGGKSRVSKQIVKKIPPHKVYVEPFMGGGSVYFQKTLAPNANVINDKNKHLINHYKKMAKISPHKFDSCKNLNRTQWERIKKKYDQGKLLDACEFQQLVNGAYGCKIETTWGYNSRKEGKPVSVNVMKNLDHYQNKLNKTKIINQDYKTVTKNYDGKNTFFYVDPPYNNTYVKYDMPPIDLIGVAETYKNVKGKVMISYNNSSEVKKAFPRSDGWKYNYITIPYTLQSKRHGVFKPKKELLITNY